MKRKGKTNHPPFPQKEGKAGEDNVDDGQEQTYDEDVKLDNENFLCVKPINSMVKSKRPLKDMDTDSLDALIVTAPWGSIRPTPAIMFQSHLEFKSIESTLTMENQSS